MKSRRVRFIQSAAVLIACLAALATATCSSKDSSPTSPSTTTTTPTTPVTPAPPVSNSGSGSVDITLNPNPVSFSGQPITTAASCAGYANTWFYDQVLRETSGVDVTFTSRVNTFDGNLASQVGGFSMVVPAHSSVTWRTSWCSGARIKHTAQTTWSGTDANGHTVSATGPVATLMP